MRASLILLACLVSISATAQSFPSLTQLLYFENTDDSGFFDQDKQKEVYQKAYPFLDPAFSKDGEDEARVSNAVSGILVLGEMKMNTAIRFLGDIKELETASAYEIISGSLRSDKNISVNDIISSHIDGGPITNAALLKALKSEAFQGRIQSLSREEKYFASLNLFQATRSMVFAMELIEQRMELAGYYTLPAISKKQKIEDYFARQNTMRDLVSQRSQIQYARKAFKKSMGEIAQIALDINGRGSDAELVLLGLGNKNSVLNEMIKNSPRADLIKKSSALFSTLDRELINQLRLAHDYSIYQKSAIEVNRKDVSNYGETMKQSPVKLGGHGLSNDNAMAARFTNYDEDFNAFKQYLFSDERKWTELLELLYHSDGVVEKSVSDRLIKVIETFEMPTIQVLKNINEAEIEVRALARVEAIQQYEKNKSFEQILEEQKSEIRNQKYSINYENIFSLSIAFDSLFFVATQQVFAVDQNYAHRAERALRMLLRIKSKVRTAEFKSHLKYLGERMLKEHKKSIAEMTQENPAVGTLAAEFTGVKEITWLSPRSRALVVSCDTVLKK
jgi:hypothetical protein